jgi:hypothetical protein
MPFTQGLWSWDKFLHGGQDFELGLLIILTCLCLVLLRVQQSELCLRRGLVLRALLPKALRRAASASLAFSLPTGHRPQIPVSLLPARAALPLRI